MEFLYFLCFSHRIIQNANRPATKCHIGNMIAGLFSECNTITLQLWYEPAYFGAGFIHLKPDYLDDLSSSNPALVMIYYSQIMCFSRPPRLDSDTLITATTQTHLIRTLLSTIPLFIVCIKLGGITDMTFATLINITSHILISVGCRVKRIIYEKPVMSC